MDHWEEKEEEDEKEKKREAEAEAEEEEEAAQSECPQDEITAVPPMDPGYSAAALPRQLLLCPLCCPRKAAPSAHTRLWGTSGGNRVWWSSAAPLVPPTGCCHCTGGQQDHVAAQLPSSLKTGVMPSC